MTRRFVDLSVWLEDDVLSGSACAPGSSSRT